MTISIFSALAVASAAFFVWLGVRIVNRRERWAKWTAVTVVGVVAYPLSFGPVCWLCEHGVLSQKTAWFAYRPITWLACKGPVRFAVVINEYGAIWGDNQRLTKICERSEYVLGWSSRPVRRVDSVSPIDYEIEQSHGRGVAALVIMELRGLSNSRR